VKPLDPEYKLSLLAGFEVAYYVAPGGWVPLYVGDTTTVLANSMPEAVCTGCPLAAYSHVLRAALRCPHVYEKLCTIPFVRGGKISLEALMQYQGCGAKDSDYARARKLVSRGRL
jgi:hypothetical protein